MGLPWVELGDFPTPVQKLEQFGAKVDLPNLYVKRDDLSSKVYGSNKVRKMGVRPEGCAALILALLFS